MNNPYSQQTIEYKLSIPPSKVLEIVSSRTEERGFRKLFNLSQQKYTRFWSQCNGIDIFKISRKESARGYSNSFAPWLVGWVTPDNTGSKINMFFEIDGRVLILSQISSYVLIFFTIIVGWPFISNAFAGALKIDNWIGAIFIFVFWIFNYGLKKIGYHLGQQDKVAIIEFVESIFSAYKVA